MTEGTIEVTAPSIRVQAGKVLVATMAAFIATKLAEGVYETLIAKHQAKTDSSEQ